MIFLISWNMILFFSFNCLDMVSLSYVNIIKIANIKFCQISPMPGFLQRQLIGPSMCMPYFLVSMSYFLMSYNLFLKTFKRHFKQLKRHIWKLITPLSWGFVFVAAFVVVVDVCVCLMIFLIQYSKSYILWLCGHKNLCSVTLLAKWWLDRGPLKCIKPTSFPAFAELCVCVLGMPSTLS